MKSFEHRYILHIGLLSINLSERHLNTVLRLFRKLFPDKCIFIEIK